MKITIKIADKPEGFEAHHQLRRIGTEATYCIAALKSVTFTDDAVTIIGEPHDQKDRAEPIF